MDCRIGSDEICGYDEFLSFNDVVVVFIIFSLYRGLSEVSI